MPEMIPESGTRTEPETLTRDDLDALFRVGELMCQDMVDAASIADTLTDRGITVNPRWHVTHQMTNAWVAIACEYEQALDELEANGTL